MLIHATILRARRSIGLGLVVALLCLAGCTNSQVLRDRRLDGVDSDLHGFSISYQGARNLLEGKSSTDATEQVRDWARTGIADYLGLSTDQLRDTSYDSFPLRDGGFSGLGTQPTGPGRSLLDNHGVLHLLVPKADAHAPRTIGLLLDQYRTDSGTDPAHVQIDRYQIDRGSQQIAVTPEPVTSPSSLRTANGYVTMPIDTRARLKTFLAKTSSLSQLEVRGSTVWASGWHWQTPHAASIDETDVSVLQRGYLNADRGSMPGFSLDPHPIKTVADLRAVVPGLSAEMAGRVIHNRWSGSPFSSARELEQDYIGNFLDHPKQLAGKYRREVIRAGLPTELSQLWALDTQLRRAGAYSQARYDGGLAGTEVGMTLFYTDYVAKNWKFGVGSGVPTGKVAGFVPDSKATTPWGECRTADERGRLWFAQNDAAFNGTADSISLGAQPTRLFSRSYGGGGEVQPSYAAGRGLAWWDQNYQSVADYEPQYQRLDDIMRWSGALDWLAAQGGPRLPQLSNASIQHNLKFAQWYPRQHALRERSTIDFVKPPSATQEAVAHMPSAPRENCGLIGVGGGVSLGDQSLRLEGKNYRPMLPEQVERAGNFDPSSRFDRATGSGDITEVTVEGDGTESNHVERLLSREPNSHDVVTTVADGRKVENFGGLKIWRNENASQHLSVDLVAGAGKLVEQVSLEGRSLGQLSASRAGHQVTLQWTQGPMQRAARALASVQKVLSRQRSGPPPAPTEDVLYGVRDRNGSIAYRVDDGQESRADYISIKADTSKETAELAFRLGAPSRPKQPPVRWFEATFADPHVPPEQWLNITPATADQPVLLTVAKNIRNHEHTVAVSAPDGKTIGAVRFDAQGNAIIKADTLASGPGGAMLAPHSQQIWAAMTQAKHAGDGLYRAIDLPGDTAALVGDHHVILVPGGHAWAGKIGRDIARRPSGASEPVLLYQVAEHDIFLASTRPMTAAGPPRQLSVADLMHETGQRVFQNDAFRSTFTFHNGSIIASTLAPQTLVTVRVFHVDAEAAQADVQAQHTTHWWHVTTNPTSANPTPTPTDATLRGAQAPTSATEILLVCPQHSTPELTGCRR